jgi:hypothetical protein
MGYDFHITRREHWSDDGPLGITLDEWLDVVAKDAEMRLDGRLYGSFFLSGWASAGEVQDGDLIDQRARICVEKTMVAHLVRTTRVAFSTLALLALVMVAQATELPYPPEVARWKEIAIPAETDKGAQMAWFYAANYSRHEWRVIAEGNKIVAQLTDQKQEEKRERPAFNPKADQFSGASLFSRVDDGWLVGFNHGEFGAALYWFNKDGTRNYKISDHQVVEFFVLPNGTYAIEGLAHLGSSHGSIVRLARAEPGARWRASVVTRLPYAPYAISVGRDNDMFITLSDALVSVGDDRRVETLLGNAPWSGLYPNSSVLSSDHQKLYIGMRQFVAEWDIPTKKIRFLIPSGSFLNKLPQKDEQRIRKLYGG